MKTRIVKIGNSHGIRISKPLMEQLGIERDIEIHVEGNKLIIRRAGESRARWGASFMAMAESGDDMLLDEKEMSGPSLNEEEWDWE